MSGKISQRGEGGPRSEDKGLLGGWRGAGYSPALAQLQLCQTQNPAGLMEICSRLLLFTHLELTHVGRLGLGAESPHSHRKIKKWEVSCEPTLKSRYKGHLHCPPPGNCPNRQRREITTNPKLLRRYILTSLSIDFSLFISKLG